MKENENRSAEMTFSVGDGGVANRRGVCGHCRRPKMGVCGSRSAQVQALADAATGACCCCCGCFSPSAAGALAWAGAGALMARLAAFLGGAGLLEPVKKPVTSGSAAAAAAGAAGAPLVDAGPEAPLLETGAALAAGAALTAAGAGAALAAAGAAAALPTVGTAAAPLLPACWFHRSCSCAWRARTVSSCDLQGGPSWQGKQHRG
jgi:hypothetical protein